MDTSNFNAAFEYFTDLLNERFSRGIYTTEDTIRYTFYYALLTRLRLDPHMITLEWPYPGTLLKSVDTYIDLDDTGVAIEFKYHRRSQTQERDSSLPFQYSENDKTEKAGELFADMCRLCRVPADKRLTRLLVYCLSNTMDKHWRTGWLKYGFYVQPKGKQYRIDKDYFSKRADSFLKQLLDQFEDYQECSFDLELCWEEPLKSKAGGVQHQIRIYEVHPVTD